MELGYFLIHALIIAGPLWYTFHPRVAYYRHFRELGVSILVVGGGYIAWDIAATAWGEWSFNPQYLIGADIFNLPVEEVLFFITVPYATIFIYEVVRAKEGAGGFRLSAKVFWAAVMVMAAGGIAFMPQGYTSKALGACALFLVVARWLDFPLLQSRAYWVWLAICQVPFLVVNTVLTALPVVLYNDAAIWGARFITIPLEDFFYNFSLLSFYLLVYRLAGKARERSGPRFG